MEVEKTPERVKFESEHNCFIYLTREENRYGYDVDSVYESWLDEPEEILSTVSLLKTRGRYNMGETRAIWLPKDSGFTKDWFYEEYAKEILDKYSFKI